MKKKPQRSCVSCRTVRDKNELLRVVVTPEGDVVYDPTGKLAGRGAYLCRNEACITAELKKAAKLSKGLKKEYSRIAAKRGVNFLAAADYVSPSSKDQEHLNEAGHSRLANITLRLQKQGLSVKLQVSCTYHSRQSLLP